MDSYRQSEGFFIEQNVERYLYEIYPDFLPKCVFYKGVSYEYKGDGIVVITGSPGAKYLDDTCIELLEVGEKIPARSGIRVVNRTDLYGRKYHKTVPYESPSEEARRPLRILHIIGDFTKIPGGFLNSDFLACSPLKELYMDQTKIKSIGDKDGGYAFEGVSRGPLTHLELPTTIRYIHENTLHALRGCPNLNQPAKEIVDALYQ